MMNRQLATIRREQQRTNTMFRATTPEEKTILAFAPEWTKSFTGDCEHNEMHVYKDGTIECSRCGICIPENGNWEDSFPTE